MKASIPVPAVKAGGRSRVRSGSQIAVFGRRCGERAIVFRPVCGSWINVPLPASLPVPAVVGTAIIGGIAGLDLVLASPSQVVVRESARMRDHEPDRLGGVDRTAASHPDHSVALCVAIATETSQNVFFGRVGLDLAEDDRCLPREPTTCATSPLAISPGSVTTKGRVIPSRANSPASRFLAPAPKRMRLGNVNVETATSGMPVGRPRFGRNGSPGRGR